MTAGSSALRRAARRAAARHEPGNIHYLTGLRQLERRAARRARRRRDALHRLPLHRGRRRRSRASRSVLTKRVADASTSAGRLDGQVAFEADVLPYVAGARRSARQGSSSCRRPASSRRCARSRTRRRSRRSRRAARAADRAFEALTAETWVGRSERELAWRLRELLHAHGVDHLAFDTIVAAGHERREAARASRPTASSRRGRSSPSTGAPASTATAPTARARSRPGRCPTRLRRDLRRLPRGAARRRRRDPARA